MDGASSFFLSHQPSIALPHLDIPSSEDQEQKHPGCKCYLCASKYNCTSLSTKPRRTPIEAQSKNTFRRQQQTSMTFLLNKYPPHDSRLLFFFLQTKKTTNVIYVLSIYPTHLSVLRIEPPVLYPFYSRLSFFFLRNIFGFHQKTCVCCVGVSV